MVSRHFLDIQKLREPAFEIHDDLRQSIQDLLDLGVMDLIEEIIERSDTATREKKLDEQITKMREEWKSIAFEMIEYKDSGVNILTGIQPIWELLDEHIQKTMTIMSSPYVKFMRATVVEWKQ
jgi:dynein heavy chain